MTGTPLAQRGLRMLVAVVKVDADPPGALTAEVACAAGTAG
jgi:hypothetical protein